MNDHSRHAAQVLAGDPVGCALLATVESVGFLLLPVGRCLLACLDAAGFGLVAGHLHLDNVAQRGHGEGDALLGRLAGAALLTGDAVQQPRLLFALLLGQLLLALVETLRRPFASGR